MPSLAHETPDELRSLMDAHVDLVDLELASIAAWCAEDGVCLLPLLAVSDVPQVAPIWRTEDIEGPAMSCVRRLVQVAVNLMGPGRPDDGGGR